MGLSAVFLTICLCGYILLGWGDGECEGEGSASELKQNEQSALVTTCNVIYRYSSTSSMTSVNDDARCYRDVFKRFLRVFHIRFLTFDEIFEKLGKFYTKAMFGIFLQLCDEEIRDSSKIHKILKKS